MLQALSGYQSMCHDFGLIDDYSRKKNELYLKSVKFENARLK